MIRFRFVRCFSIALVSAVLADSVGAPLKVEAATVKEIHNSEKDQGVSGRTFDLRRDLIVGDEGSDEGANTQYLFGRINDIGVSSNFHIYVVDRGYRRVQEYDSAATYVRTLGHSGEGPGEYLDPFAVALDAADNVYIASQSKVAIYRRDGQYLTEFRDDLTGFVRRMRVGGDNRLYLSSYEPLGQTIIHIYNLADTKRLRSFCDSYAVGKKVDTRVEMVVAGGTFDIERDIVYYSQSNPYEVRMFSLDGELTTVVYRENDFIEEPIVQVRADGMSFGPLSASTSIVALRGGGFINVAIVPHGDREWRTVIDLFTSEGKLVATRQFDQSLPVLCKDGKDRLYAIDLSAAPRVSRYRMVRK